MREADQPGARELIDRLALDPFFVALRKAVAGGPPDAPHVVAVLAGLRGWAATHADALGLRGARDAVVEALVTRALAPVVANSLPRRARLAARLPTPIAAPYARAADDGADLVARYAALLDTFESLQIFLVFSLLGTYVDLGVTHDPLERLVAPLVLKGRLSSGDWSTILSGAARALRSRPELWIFPELVPLLAPPSGASSRLASVLLELCQVRNDAWGHRIGRTPDYYAGRIERDFALLDEQLDALACLEGAQLVVPTRVEGRRVCEGRVYLGDAPEKVLDLDVELVTSGAAPLALRPDASAVICRDDGRAAHLFPFYRFRRSREPSQRGVYFLARWQWARQRGRARLRDVEYFAQDPTAPSARERDDVLATVEHAFKSFVSRADEASLGALAVEDPDHRIHTLWAEQAEVAGRLVGQSAVLSELASHVAPADRGGTVVLVGGPGSGKTSLAYALFEQLADAHPLLHSVPRERDALAFVRALIHQCSAHLGRPLGDAAYAGDALSTLRASLERALVELTEAPGSRCVVVVDALDELEVREDRWDEALGWLPGVRPPGLWVVLTCRPHGPLLRALARLCAGAMRVEVPALRRDDLAEFASRHFGVDDLGEIAPVVDARVAFDRLDGHPLLLRAVLGEALREVRAARAAGRPPRPVDPAELASDVTFPFAALWDRLVDDARAQSGDGRRRRRVLEFLSIAHDPGLTVPLLRAVLEADEGAPVPFDAVLSSLDVLSPWLREPAAGRYLPFHLSLAEYIRHRLGDREVRALHAIMTRVLRDVGSVVDPGYWVARTTTHATLGGLARSVLVELVDDPAWMLATLATAAGRPARGASFGHWVAATAGNSEPCDVVARRLRERWGRGGPEYPRLDHDAREQLAECFVATGRRVLAEEAFEVLGDLERDTRDANFLSRRAWVAYQALDRWMEARADFERSAAALHFEGDARGAARALRLLAAVVFDTGGDGAEAVLADRCLPALEALGDAREIALAEETLGVVVDAEARWDDALAHYARAANVHERFGDAYALRRVALNRSVALLFRDGLDAARAALDGALRTDAVDQVGQYARVNAALLALLSGDRAAFSRMASELRPDELWMQLTFRESAAVLRWFEGDDRWALAEFFALADELDALDDAWGRVDNEVNAGFLLSRRDPAHAVDLLSQAHAASIELEYCVGEAMAAEGLRRLGVECDQGGRAEAFFATYLAHLFRRCPSPFVPCYVLLLP